MAVRRCTAKDDKGVQKGRLFYLARPTIFKLFKLEGGDE